MTTAEQTELTTGWEPDVPAGDTLLRATVLAWADRVRHQTASIGGRVEDQDGAVSTSTGVANPFYNNTLLLRPPTDRTTIERMIAFHDRPFVLWSAWPIEDLRPLGLTLMGHPPFLLRPAGGAGRATPESLDIVEVATAADAAEFERTLVEGYPLPGASPSTGRFLTAEGLGGGSRYWIGWETGRAVAVAAAHTAHGVNLVEFVACRGEARGRGYGEAITWAATLADPTLPAVLLASDDGRPVYERMGYLPVSRFTAWFRP
jgi:hypothetical protein